MSDGGTREVAAGEFVPANRFADAWRVLEHSTLVPRLKVGRIFYATDSEAHTLVIVVGDTWRYGKQYDSQTDLRSRRPRSHHNRRLRRLGPSNGGRLGGNGRQPGVVRAQTRALSASRRGVAKNRSARTGPEL